MAAAVNLPPVPNTVPVDSLGIPKSLRSLDQWVNWEWEYQPSRTKPYTKVPYNPTTKRKAKSNTRSTWVACAAALTAYDEHRFPGIGFVLSPDDPFGFIDLDNCRNPQTYEVEVWAQSVIDLFQDRAYIELSPSGNGIKIIGRFTWPSERAHVFRLHGGQIEVYTNDKYTTITGAVLAASQEEPGYIQDAIEQLAELYFPLKQEEPITRIYDRTPLDMDDDALIGLIRSSRQAPKFERLYLDGSSADYDGDESAADAGLVSILAFYTRNDIARIDRIFRSSARMRPKWDSKRRDGTYGSYTIQKMVSRTTQVYEPRNASQKPQPPRGTKRPDDATETPEFEWISPIDIPEPPDTPAMTADMIPSPLADWITQEADRISIHPEMIAAPALVAASALIGRSIGIKPWEFNDYIVVPNLWGALVQPPGSMKSFAIDEGSRFVLQLAAQATERYRNAIRENELKLVVLAEREKVAKRQLQSDIKAGSPLAPAYETLREIKDEIKAAHVTERRYVTHDATIEKLGELIVENPRGILVLRDELYGLIRSFDKSGHEEDRQFYLSAWSGKTAASVDRIGRGTIHLPPFALSLFGTIQPGKLRSIIDESASGSNGDDGLLQRFQILIWPGQLPEWKKPTSYGNRNAKIEAFKVFQFLDNLDGSQIAASRNEGDIPFLAFTPSAQRLADEWLSGLEARQRNPVFTRDMPSYCAHLSKYRSLMPSLALIFHLIDLSVHGDDTRLVSDEAVERAIAWCNYLEEHIKHVYDVEIDQGKRSARLLLAKIKSGAIVDGQSVREIYRHHWHGLSNDELVMQGIPMLAEHNIARTEPGATGGRPTQVIRINPALFKEDE